MNFVYEAFVNRSWTVNKPYKKIIFATLSIFLFVIIWFLIIKRTSEKNSLVLTFYLIANGILFFCCGNSTPSPDYFVYWNEKFLPSYSPYSFLIDIKSVPLKDRENLERFFKIQRYCSESKGIIGKNGDKTLLMFFCFLCLFIVQTTMFLYVFSKNKAFFLLEILFLLFVLCSYFWGKEYKSKKYNHGNVDLSKYWTKETIISIKASLDYNDHFDVEKFAKDLCLSEDDMNSIAVSILQSDKENLENYSWKKLKMNNYLNFLITVLFFSFFALFYIAK